MIFELCPIDMMTMIKVCPSSHVCTNACIYVCDGEDLMYEKVYEVRTEYGKSSVTGTFPHVK